MTGPRPRRAFAWLRRDLTGQDHQVPRRRLAAERWVSAAAKLAVMTLDIGPNQAWFGIAIPLERFGLLATEHFQRVRRTTEIEDQARALIGDDFPEDDAVRFVKDVCGWGGYPGIAGRVVHRNEPVNIRNALLTAASQLLVAEPDPAKALMAVNRLKGLGRPSFASKHLRFLCPQMCPVFDELLQAALPYSFDPSGYGRFAADCQRLAEELSRKAIPNPWPGRNGRWHAADAEAAVYEHVRSLAFSE